MCVFAQEAEKAKSALDGKRALGKKIVVDWARLDPATKKNVKRIIHIRMYVQCMVQWLFYDAGELCI